MFDALRVIRCVSVLVFMMVFVGCSSSPMKTRLERNFVYNCSLQLLDKNVPAGDAERICSSSHNAEMEEKRFNLGIRTAKRAQASTNRAPASQPTVHPAAQPVETPSPESTESE